MIHLRWYQIQIWIAWKDNLDVDTFKIVPANLIETSNVVDNDGVKKTLYDILVIKGNATDTKIPSSTGSVIKIQIDSDKQGLEKKVEDVDKNTTNTSGLVKMTDCNIKITEIENETPIVAGLITTEVLNKKATEIKNKIPSITNLATKAAVNTKTIEVESEIPDITILTTKVALNTKSIEIEKKPSDATGFITTPEFNRLTKISCDTKIKKASKGLASKS